MIVLEWNALRLQENLEVNLEATIQIVMIQGQIIPGLLTRKFIIDLHLQWRSRFSIIALLSIADVYLEVEIDSIISVTAMFY